MTPRLIRLWLIVLIFITMAPMSFGKVSESSCYAVYAKLLRDNHIKNAPRLVVVHSPKVNAYADGNIIVMYTGMLKFLHNDSEVASVLGHELSHYLLHHPKSTIPNEYAADKLGATIMSHSGYNKCVGFIWFLRLNDPGSDTHPPSVTRYHVLGC